MLFSDKVAYFPSREIIDRLLIEVSTGVKALLYMIDNEPLAHYLAEEPNSKIYCINDCELFKECKFKDTDNIQNFNDYDSLNNIPLQEINLFVFDHSLTENSAKFNKLLLKLPKNVITMCYTVNDEVSNNNFIPLPEYKLELIHAIEVDKITESPTIAEYLHHKLMVHAMDSKFVSILSFVKQYCTSDSPKIVNNVTYQIFKRKLSSL